MILSNVEIQRAIDDGRLVLDPEPLPRRLGSEGRACPYQTSSIDLRLGEELRPGRVVLARTLERVELPIGEEGRCLAARVEGKSSYARCGLLIHFTAPTIHAGFEGTITLELYNLGPLGISLYPGTPICQLIVEMVAGVPFRNDSQFQGQRAAGGKFSASSRHP
jgi:dCTP deaminase